MMTSKLDGAGSGVFVEKSPLDVHILALPTAEPSLRRDNAWRHERVATAAYYLAAKRGFEPGHEAEDWALAELQTDAIDAGRKL
jgi:hypothetical protein